jgi:hypothetical protein
LKIPPFAGLFTLRGQPLPWLREFPWLQCSGFLEKKPRKAAVCHLNYLALQALTTHVPLPKKVVGKPDISATVIL